MTVASEIARIQGVKANILDAIAAKGVTVPSGAKLADCPNLIGNITQGNNDSVYYYPAQQNILEIDANGFIGNAISTSPDYTYTASLNHTADYSQYGLGQVNILGKGKIEPIDTLTIGQNSYGVVKLGPWLIIDRNLQEAVGSYIFDSTHAETGYWYLGSSLWDANNNDFTTTAKDFCASIGSGWSFVTREFIDWIEANFRNYANVFFRKESFNNGNNMLGLNIVPGRYSDGSKFNYDTAIYPGRYGNRTRWVIIQQSDRLSIVDESDVLHFYNPNRLIKKIVTNS